MPEYAELHTPIIPVLAKLLEGVALQAGEVALDLACGAGEKLPLLRAAIGPQAMLLALDTDQAALAAFPADAYTRQIRATAQAIPLHEGACSLVACIAALGLFADSQAALREMHRVLQPYGRLFVVTSRQVWAQVTYWPPGGLAALANAYAKSPPLAAHSDVLEDALDPFYATGFTNCSARAFLLAPTTAHTELALLPWSYLAPHLGHALTGEQRRACAAAPVEVELCTVALGITTCRLQAD